MFLSRLMIVRIGLGLLLLAAAGLKFYGLGVSAMPSVGWFAQPWVQLAAAEWELVLGLWLISGSYPKGSWFAAVATFLTFAGVSGYLGFSGVVSCGCLGAAQASPWWAFGIDAAALVLLAMAYPRGERVSSNSFGIGVKWAGGVAVLLVVTTVAASAVYGSTEAALARLRGDSLFTEPYLDLGAGKPGDVLESAAIVRNVSNRPIRLVGGTSDCSCTALRDLPVTIDPGETAAIGVQMNVPPADRGRLTRTVFLRTDDPHQTGVRFRIGCRVE